MLVLLRQQEAATAGLGNRLGAWGIGALLGDRATGNCFIVDFGFANVFGRSEGSTGSVGSAACKGSCGQEAPNPLDVVFMEAEETPLGPPGTRSVGPPAPRSIARRRCGATPSAR